MAKRKSSKKYCFSVEGKTEKWYLEWLQGKINTTGASAYNVIMDCQVQPNPLKRAKSMTITGKTEIWHLSDYESDDAIHVKEFMETMDNMKAAKLLGKQIQYHFGYSNFTFDLWIILHVIDCSSPISHRKNYLNFLNRAYSECFESMDEYKREANFKRCLKKLELSNVIDAVNRAKSIMQNNQNKGYTLREYKGYKYYRENPSLEIWRIIEKILIDCKLI